MALKSLYIFCFFVLSQAALAAPDYAPGELTAENSADYVRDVIRNGVTPPYFLNELARLYLSLYPSLDTAELDLEGLSTLDAVSAKDRVLVVGWLLSQPMGDARSRDLAARVLKFDPYLEARAKSASAIANFKQLSAPLFELCVERMLNDLDAEVRLRLIQSLSALYVDMGDAQAEVFRNAVEALKERDVAVSVVNAAAEALSCAQDLRREAH